MGDGISGKVTKGGAPSLTTESRRHVLRSPTFLVALVVLVVNDQWLKGVGVLPGWLTGKLSDFAGLIVAPLLLVVLMHARSRLEELACFAAVSLGFAALELSPQLARAVEQLTRVLHLDWRLWPDPTDLLALVVLPLAWRVLHAHRVTVRPSPRMEKSLGIAAMLACLATSGDARRVSTSLALFNITHENLDLQIYRPGAPLDCDAVSADPEARLAPESFDLESCPRLMRLDALPVDIDWGNPDEHGTTPEPITVDRPCDAVLVRASGVRDTVVFWTAVSKVELFAHGGEPEDKSRVAYVERFDDELIISTPDYAVSFVATSVPPANDCPKGAP